MITRLLARLTYANVVSTLAVFLLLGGTSYAAATLAANSVGNKQLKDNAVTSSEVKDSSLRAKDFAGGQLPAGVREPAGPAGPAGAAAPDKGLLDGTGDIPDGQFSLTVGGVVQGTLFKALAVNNRAGGYSLAISGVITSNPAFSDWYRQAASGDPAATKNFLVSRYDNVGALQLKYGVTQGRPQSYRELGNRFELVFTADLIQREA